LPNRFSCGIIDELSGCGAAGSALDWGSRGREFKSRHSDQLKALKSYDFKAFLQLLRAKCTVRKCVKTSKAHKKAHNCLEKVAAAAFA
jgi:hypothetical protein